MKTLSIAPTWRGIMPALLAVYTDAATPHAREQARQEIMRCAAIADDAVAFAREVDAETPDAPEPTVRHADAVTPVPEGFDTVLGYLAKHHADVLDGFDYRDPEATQRDGFWLSHRFHEVLRVTAPACLRERGVDYVRIWPVDLLEQRWG